MKKARNIIYYVLMTWLALTSIVQRFKCPAMTETQLFMSIPDYVLLKFECK